MPQKAFPRRSGHQNVVDGPGHQARVKCAHASNEIALMRRMKYRAAHLQIRLSLRAGTFGCFACTCFAPPPSRRSRFTLFFPSSPPLRSLSARHIKMWRGPGITSLVVALGSLAGLALQKDPLQVVLGNDEPARLYLKKSVSFLTFRRAAHVLTMCRFRSAVQPNRRRIRHVR